MDWDWMDFTDCLEPSGVYLLMLEGRVVYAGKSTNVFNRLAQHRNRLRKPTKPGYRPGAAGPIKIIQFDEVRVCFARVEDLDDLERELILQYQPEGNTQTPAVAPRGGVEIDLAKLGVLETWKRRSEVSSDPSSLRRI